MKYFIYLFVFFMIQSCSSEKNNAPKQNIDHSGDWRAVIHLNDSTELPFELTISKSSDSTYKFDIHNQDEIIEHEGIAINNNEFSWDISIFESVIKAKIEGDQMSGEWIRTDKDDYKLKFTATKGEKARFLGDEKATHTINGQWEVSFVDPSSGEIETAIGIFQNEHNSEHIKATFLTTTGDYRYLAGRIIGNQLHLSCFDGAHAFYFTADVVSSEEITNGIFYSGKTWKQAWTAKLNPSIVLEDAYTLTKVKPNEQFDFAFPNEKGDTVRLAGYKGKPVIVQILGTWCPNCMDETKFLGEAYREYKDQGLEIVGLAFENAADFETSFKRINKVKIGLKAEYPILLAANSTSKEEAAKKLPSLNHIKSYPTTIYIDRNGKVVKIHTGFSGPGTGSAYNKFKDSFKQTVNELLAN